MRDTSQFPLNGSFPFKMECHVCLDVGTPINCIINTKIYVLSELMWLIVLVVCIITDVSKHKTLI